MSIPILCLILAALLILVTKAPVAVAMAREGGGRYDNRNPRAQQARLTGFGARALAAHHNTIEAFPVFAAGLLAALWASGEAPVVSWLAVTFVVARLAYAGCYWADIHLLRSLTWGVGFFASLALMGLALF
jgi:uncharacterized MAPEG superfamily protein